MHVEQTQMNANDIIPPSNSTMSISSNQPKNVAKKSRVQFKGMPKYSPTNLDTVGLRRSPRIANVRQKQLDASLNHVGFIHVDKASEEDMIDPMKETFTFKKSMTSPRNKILQRQ